MQWIVTTFFVATLATSQAMAQQGPSVLLELFTSQGCYSCPPAEKLLGEKFVGRNDVLALEMHVDYWDDLVYWGSSWKDPYSSPQFTKRQGTYATTTARSPFTPQAIIQGAYSASGTNGNALESAISEVKGLDLARGWKISFENDGGLWSAVIDEAEGNAVAYSVIFAAKAETVVTAGENKGKTLVNHNVVTNFVSHGTAQQGDKIKIGEAGQGNSCALIVQRPPQGVVIGAWSCPAT